MINLPAKGTDAEAILARMEALREQDIRWREGKTWSLVFFAGDEVADLLHRTYSLFMAENGLNPMVFPSLKRFETEVVAMAAALLGGNEATVGNMTSGGTESILLAVKSARDWARATKPAITAPEIVLPASAHPAFEKAGEYLDVRLRYVPVGPDFRADLAATRVAITPNTILLVGSAPAYPHGVVDPIHGLGQLAQEHGILMHVDACVGGFMLPFVRKLGYDIPAFDLSVPGVTSLSADLHKYGYAAKGAAVLLYGDAALRRHQFCVTTDWSGGIYASPTIMGTRPGGAIAAAWAILHYLGEEGYLAIADTVMRTVTRLRQGIDAIPGLKVLGEPDMSLLAIGSDGLNVYAVADEMAQSGWHLDRQQSPPSLHMTVTHAHAAVADQFLADLAQSADHVRRVTLQGVAGSAKSGIARAVARFLPAGWVRRIAARSSASAGETSAEPKRSAAMYGLLASLPDRGDLAEIVKDLLEQMSRPEATRAEPGQQGGG